MHPSQTNSTLRTDSKPRLGTSHIPRIPPQPSRPKSLAELMDRVEQSIGDGDRPFKVWLRVAESTRTDAESFLEKGENESAFVSFSISSRIVLEKIPTHPDYRVLLDPTQRHNLKLHGQKMLSRLSKLKPIITTRYNQWLADATRSVEPASTPAPVSVDRVNNDITLAHSQSLGHERHPLNTVTPRSQPPNGNQDSFHSSVVSHHMVHQLPGVLGHPHGNPRVQGPVSPTLTHEETRVGSPTGSVSSVWSDHTVKTVNSANERTNWNRFRTLNDDRARYLAQQSRVSEEDEDIGQSGSESSSDDSVATDLAAFSDPASEYMEPTSASTSTSSEAGAGTQTPYMQPVAKLTIPTIQLSDVGLPPGSVPFVPHVSKSPLKSTPKSPIIGITAIPPSPASHNTELPAGPELSTSHLLSPESAITDLAEVSTQGPAHSVPRDDVLAPTPRMIPLELEEFFAPTLLPDVPIRDLMAVHFPAYDCLERFISIGRINTERNRETCGLLLGKQKDRRYVVTTLLIPKQISTHNACTMEDEVAIAQFAKQHALVTLGWIHIHPTEPCFMTSVDLHVQSIFQSVLPEAFAVICSPKHSPNFMIYRLTDPSGIRTILSCEESNALHTHTERQLYAPTDHVHVTTMWNMPLEVVDLR